MASKEHSTTVWRCRCSFRTWSQPRCRSCVWWSQMSFGIRRSRTSASGRRKTGWGSRWVAAPEAARWQPIFICFLLWRAGDWECALLYTIILTTVRLEVDVGPNLQPCSWKSALVHCAWSLRHFQSRLVTVTMNERLSCSWRWFFWWQGSARVSLHSCSDVWQACKTKKKKRPTRALWAKSSCSKRRRCRDSWQLLTHFLVNSFTLAG